MPKLPSNKINPYKIIVLLLYGDYEWCKWEDLHCQVKSGKLARLLGKPIGKIYEYVEWLQQRHYIADYRRGRGWFSFTLIWPRNLPVSPTAGDLEYVKPEGEQEFIVDFELDEGEDEDDPFKIFS